MTDAPLALESNGFDAERRRRGHRVFQEVVWKNLPINRDWVVGNHQYRMVIKTIRFTPFDDPELDVDFFCDGQELEYSKPLVLVHVDGLNLALEMMQAHATEMGKKQIWQLSS